MISLEQVQQLEAKIAKAIEYVQRVTAENAVLVSEREGLQTKLDANQKRIDELEVLVMRFKEDQGRIEDGIIAALDRLSQFEEAFENSLKEKVTKKPAAKTRAQAAQPSSKEIFFEIPEASSTQRPEHIHGSAQVEDADSLNDELPSEGELDIF
ncbi:MAG: cell division protein ZapB [Treponema sp.]|jgi:predicted nuclease with TOPRIM domain|nr:cell division protein ZapB [Treponema sp.]